MSKLCQGPLCHLHDTDDRKRGPKGNKKNQTRMFSGKGYGQKNFCTLGCYNDWADENMDRAVDYIGRLREPKTMTVENAWDKRRHWSYERASNPSLPEFYYHNMCTNENRELTQQQYNDDNYTLNT